MADPNDPRVPLSLRRKFKSHADLTEGDRRVAEKEGKRLDEAAKAQALENIYGPGKGGPRVPSQIGPRPPGGHRRVPETKLEAETKRLRNLMAKGEFNRVKSIGETKLKQQLHERGR